MYVEISNVKITKKESLSTVNITADFKSNDDEDITDLLDALREAGYRIS